MNEATLRVLEFDKILALLAGFTVTGPGHAELRQLQPLAQPEEAAEALAEVTEMTGLLERDGRPPLGGCRDLTESLRQLHSEGAWLPSEDLLDVLSSLEAAADCRRYFAAAPDAIRLATWAAGLSPCAALARELRDSIGPRGDILDSASFELGELRYGIQRLRARIRRALEDLLHKDGLDGVFQDRIVTERNGRYVVPVRADAKGRIKGLVHDESASGQTLFVEPNSVLAWNNELQSLQREEQREQERILRRLSASVRDQRDALRHNQRVLARLDVRAASGHFARMTGAVAPQLAAAPEITLLGARHPLLMCRADGGLHAEDAQPVDLCLEAADQLLVISGPNTGGKSVALKTFGLLVLMVRAGLPVPCRPDSRVFLFPQVHADIGDEQSIEQHLSTFSGHLTRLREILQQAGPDALVLLDELGTGTDPAEGGALAMALLDRLRAIGARTVVTTHLNLIKGYACLRTGVRNAAVEFDPVTLAPTYRLHYGIPGASQAFAIARRLGLPEDLLADAEQYLGEGERAGLEIMERINAQQAALERELDDARRLRQEAAQERDRRKKLLAELESQRQALLEKSRRRGEQLVRETERQLKELLAQGGQSAASLPEQARLAGAVREVRDALQQPEAPPRGAGRTPRGVRTGELLRIPALRAEGEVVRVQDREVELSVAGKKLRLPLADLEQFAPRRFVSGKPRPGAVRSQVTRETFSSRLVLVGRRVDEALPLLERFLDDALLHNLLELEVVHGSGEGVLRRAVREYLAGHREVAGFHAGAVSQGGDNITLVQLRRT